MEEKLIILVWNVIGTKWQPTTKATVTSDYALHPIYDTRARAISINNIFGLNMLKPPINLPL